MTQQPSEANGWFNDPELTTEDHTLCQVLRYVWGAGAEAASSGDFRTEDGTLKEDAYLLYQRNVFRQACASLRSIFYGTANFPHAGPGAVKGPGG